MLKVNTNEGEKIEPCLIELIYVHVTEVRK